MKKSKAKPKHRHTSLYIGLAVIVVLVIAGSVYALWHKPPNQVVSPAATKQATTPSNNTEAPAVYPTNQTPTPNPNVPGGPIQSDTTPAGSPEAPSGSFVSKYTATTGDQLQSNCNTTAGAICTISFSDGQTTKSLSPETVSSSPKEAQIAAASWTWSPSSIGLTPGLWTVTATATLNGQTSVTTSSTKLDITP